MNNLSLITFDMAGTTVHDDHEVEACFAEACRKMGMEVDEAWIRSVQGWSKKFVFQTYWKERMNPDTDAFNEAVNTSYATFREVLEDHYRNSEVKPTEGCIELFAYLREHNVKIALTTGFYRKVADIILNKLGWLNGLNDEYLRSGESPIDLSITSDQVAKGRPDPDMIERAMAMLDVADPKQVGAVGDTPSDIEAGLKAKCGLVVGVTNGTHTTAQLEGLGAHHLASSLPALQKLLEKSGSTIS